MAAANRSDHACLVGTGKGALGGIRGHFAFSGFLDTVAHPCATGARHRVLPRRVRFTDLGLASESVVMMGPQGILGPQASSSGILPSLAGSHASGGCWRSGAQLSGYRITLGPDVPLAAPAWGAKWAAETPTSRNPALGALLQLLAKSQFIPNSARIGTSFPSPNINCSLAGERLSVYLVWLKSPSQGPLSCSDSISKRSRLSSSAKQ